MQHEIAHYQGQVAVDPRMHDADFQADYLSNIISGIASVVASGEFPGIVLVSVLTPDHKVITRCSLTAADEDVAAFMKLAEHISTPGWTESGAT